MPFRLGPGRTKIQFLTSAEMPSLIFRAREAAGISQTRYVQLAVCRQLARDLGLDYDELVSHLPEYKGPPQFEGKWNERVRERSQQQGA